MLFDNLNLEIFINYYDIYTNMTNNVKNKEDFERFEKKSVTDIPPAQTKRPIWNYPPAKKQKED